MRLLYAEDSAVHRQSAVQRRHGSIHAFFDDAKTIRLRVELPLPEAKSGK